jgi:hypothetical protein
MFIYKIYPAMYILGASFLFIILIFTGIRYVISEGKLYVKTWMFSGENVKISDIVSIKRSYNPLSSPACSLKRLRIDLKKQAKLPYMLLSPVREQEFIEELKFFDSDIYVCVHDKKGMWRVQDWDI